MSDSFPRLLYLSGTQDFPSPAAFEHRLRTLLDSGLPWFQLRDKTLDDRELCLLADKIRLWTRECGALFTVNDRPDIALLCGADGVHLGQEDLSALEAEDPGRRENRKGWHLGISTHNKNEVLRALTHKPDYLGVGPIFASSTKETGISPRGAGALEETRALTGLPLVAIGGISPDDVRELLLAGASTVAVGGALSHADRPEDVMETFLAVFSEGVRP
ncbi:MAG: thiamine phosphate synthase [Leptospirillia bacterium]